MIRYIPKFILKNYEDNMLEGNISGYVLLFDIADFTKIGTSLQKEGKRGAEELSRFLEQVFGDPIKIVERDGGFISLFAGDAFCAVFPDGKGESIISAINSIKAFFKDKSVYQTSFGDFDLKIRLTVCYGDINWQIFDNEVQNEYVFYGETMKEIADLSDLKEDVIFSEAATEKIGEEHFGKLEKGYRLISETIINENIPLNYKYKEHTKESFICSRLRNENPDNEIRSAAYCFINLENIDFADRKETIAVIERLADSYGGYVNKLDATDKGLIAIVLFGMPVSEGRTLERISSFSLEAVESVPELAIGISCGDVFAGYCGSGEIKEYTAFGNPVNLSARLMSKARSGEILTDSFLWQELHSKYSFQYLGILNLKGIEIPIRYYLLGKKIKEQAGYQENRFVGREDEVKTIRSYIDESIANNQNTVVYVSGDAGIGKSRLVKEALLPYSTGQCHHFHISCDAILQTPLDAIVQILKSYFYYNPSMPKDAGIQMFRGLWMGLAQGDAEMMRIESIIASLLGYEWDGSVWNVLPPEEKPNHLQNAFVRFIEQLLKSKPVLIHLDDGQWLDEKSKSYLQIISEKEIKPVIIVSPCRYLSDGEKVDLGLSKHQKYDLELSFLDEKGSQGLIKTILRSSNIPKDTLKLISERSMGNPLFIEQLTAYLMENGNINEKGEIKGEVGYLSSFSISDIISSRIDRLTDRVKECVSNASVLGREFNVKVLSKMLNAELQEELQNGAKNRIWKDLDELRYIFSHILIKDIVYGRMMNEKLQRLHQAAAEAMETVYNDNLDEHSEEIALHYEKAGMLIKAADYYDKAGCYYREIFEFVRGEENLQKGLAIKEKELGKEHPDTATSLNNLGYLYQVHGRYKESEMPLLRSLKIREKVLGKEHPDTATTLDNLAVLYTKQGKYDKAEHLCLRSLKIREKVLGEEHPETATSLHNLALVYNYTAKYYKAEIQLLRSIKIREKVLGVEHPNTMALNSFLGHLFNVQMRRDEAEPLLLRSLMINKKMLGEKHPETAESLNNLANLYTKQGKYEKAEPLFIRSLKIKEKVLGEEHSDTSVLLNNLASLYTNQGKYEKAEPLYFRSLTIAEKVLGEEHPETAIGLNNLANLYTKQGKYEKAEQLFIRSLKIKEKVLGEEHTETAITLGNLANLYFYQGKYEKAEPLYLRSLTIAEKVFGEEHPDTSVLLNNLANLYTKQGKYEKAEPLFIRSLKIEEKVLGEEHTETAISLHNLANLYFYQGKYEKVEPLFIRSLKIKEKVLGEEHTETAITLGNLATLYRDQGKYDKAEPLYIRSLMIDEKVLGKEHTETAIALGNLAYLYTKQGKYDEAEPLFLKALDVLLNKLGKKHPHTIKTLERMIEMYEKMGEKEKAEEYRKMMKNEE